jgi:hypothetical protein
MATASLASFVATDEASSPCNCFAARIFLKIRAELFNFFKVETL